LELNFLKIGRGLLVVKVSYAKNEGDGLAFVHSGGTMAKKELKPERF
jgi:uncharacterized protein (AIM24 family)